jgi:hypothetical protein
MGTSSSPSPVQQTLRLEATAEGDVLLALEGYDQCGGTGGNCKEFSNTRCEDDVYSDVPCPDAHTCTRVNERWGCAAPPAGLCRLLCCSACCVRIV